MDRSPFPQNECSNRDSKCVICGSHYSLAFNDRLTAYTSLSLKEPLFLTATNKITN
jgi:hypothetical protein